MSIPFPCQPDPFFPQWHFQLQGGHIPRDDTCDVAQARWHQVVVSPPQDIQEQSPALLWIPPGHAHQAWAPSKRRGKNKSLTCCPEEKTGFFYVHSQGRKSRELQLQSRQSPRAGLGSAHHLPIPEHFFSPLSTEQPQNSSRAAQFSLEQPQHCSHPEILPPPALQSQQPAAFPGSLFLV